MVLRPAFGKDSKEILTSEWRGEKQNETPHKCPRCDSPNTKFCYYNNYSRSQPRHFCRACRRYWTEGGTLRNVPFGGCRKNKRRKIIPSAIVATGNSTPSLRITPGGVECGISPHVLYNAPPDSPSGYSVDEFFYPPLPHSFMEDFSGVSLGFVWSGGFTAATSSSCSSSCQDVGGRGEDGSLGRMGASRATAWANEETSLPAHNWHSWYDAAEFIDAGGRQADITFQQGT